MRTVSVSHVVVAFVCCRLLAGTKGLGFLLQKLPSLVDGCCELVIKFLLVYQSW